MFRFIQVSLIAIALVFATDNSLFARGFGGFHGGGAVGGFHGSVGGFHGNVGGYHPSYHPSGASAYRAPASRNFGGGYHGGGFQGGQRIAENIGTSNFNRGQNFGSGSFKSGTPARSQLSHFMGLPTDAGLHHASNSRLPSGSPFKNEIAASQFGGHNRPDTSPFGTHSQSPAVARARANAVHKNFSHWDMYSKGWFKDHPKAWKAAGVVAATAWARPRWKDINVWFGTDWPVNGYDYGNDYYYEGNNVYYNGEPFATGAEYYDAADDLVEAGAAEQPEDSQWMALGVFSVLPGKETTPHITMQLSVNKAGVIRGNYTNLLENSVHEIHGSVDKKTQRAAWTVGDKSDIIFDTGIYDLTKDETSVLVHFSKSKTAQWLMVRMKQPDSQADSQSTGTTDGATTDPAPSSPPPPPPPLAPTTNSSTKATGQALPPIQPPVQ